MTINPGQFVQESYSELKKSSWLPRREMALSTVVVMILVGLVAVYVAGVDFVLSRALGMLLTSR